MKLKKPLGIVLEQDKATGRITVVSVARFTVCCADTTDAQGRLAFSRRARKRTHVDTTLITNTQADVKPDGSAFNDGRINIVSLAHRRLPQA